MSDPQSSLYLSPEQVPESGLPQGTGGGGNAQSQFFVTPEQADAASGPKHIPESQYDEEVSSLLDDDGFWDQPYEDKVRSLRNVYLGQDESGDRNWENEPAVIDKHKQVLAKIREHDGVPPPEARDYQGLLPPFPIPDVEQVRSGEYDTDKAKEKLDAWEQQALASARLKGGLYWKEIEDVAEPQIAERVDHAKEFISAINLYGEDPNKLQHVFSDMGAFVKGAALTATDLLPEKYSKPLHRAISTTGYLPPPSSLIDPEEASILGFKIDPQEFAQGMGSGVAFMGAGAATAAVGGPILSGAALMGAGARLGYAQGYDEVFRKTGDKEAAAKAGLMVAGIQSVSGLVDSVVARGGVTLSKALNLEDGAAFLSKLVAKGQFGESMANGFKVAADAAGSALTQGVNMGTQTALTGEAEASAANDPTLKRSPDQIAGSALIGAATGAAASIAHSATGERPPSAGEKKKAEQTIKEFGDKLKATEVMSDEGFFDQSVLPADETSPPSPPEEGAPPSTPPLGETGLVEAFKGAGKAISSNLVEAFKNAAKEGKVPEPEKKSALGQVTQEIINRGYSKPEHIDKIFDFFRSKEFTEGITENNYGKRINDFVNKHFPLREEYLEPDIVEPALPPTVGQEEIKPPETTPPPSAEQKFFTTNAKGEKVFRDIYGQEHSYEEREMPIADIQRQQDLPNFKESVTDNETGQTRPDEQLPHFYDEFRGNRLPVLEKDVTQGPGKYEIITGRNRLRMAELEPGRDTVPVNVLKESQGFTLDHARILDAESNMADNQGSVKDYAKFWDLLPTPISHETARERGVFLNTAGRQGYAIGNYGSPDLKGLFFDDKLSPKAASLIANEAPGDAGLQRIGTAQVLNGKSPEQAIDTMRTVLRAREMGHQGATQGLLFGDDEQSLRDAEYLSEVADSFKKRNAESLREYENAQRTGKSKNLAALEGVPAEAAAEFQKKINPAVIKRRIKELRQEAARWENWHSHPDLVEQVEDAARAKRQEEGQQLGLNLSGRALSALGAEEPDSTQGRLLSPAAPRYRPKTPFAADELSRLEYRPVPGEQSGPAPESPEINNAARSVAPAAPPDVPSRAYSEIWGSDPPVDGVNQNPRIPDIPESKPGKPVSPTHVIDQAAKVVALTGAKVPIREATARGLAAKNALGWYEVMPEVIRTKRANDIGTVAHEIAHAIDFNIWGYKNPFKNGYPKNFLSDLSRLGHDLYGDSRPTAGYFREGFAEFIRHFIEGNDGKLEDRAPNVLEWYNNTFAKDHPDIYEAIQKTRDINLSYKKQGDQEKIQGHIVQAKTWLERAREMVSPVNRLAMRQKAKAELLNMGGAFQDMEREANIALARLEARPGAERIVKKLEKMGIKAGEKLPVSHSPHDLFTAFAMVTNDRLAEMMQNGITDIAGNRVGVSLQHDVADIVKQAAKKYGISSKDMETKFTSYLYAKRAMALWQDTNKGPRDPGIGMEVASRYAGRIEAEHPELALAASNFYKWHDGILNYMAQASPEYARIVANIRAVDPGYYIPLQREYQTIDNLISRSGKQVTDPNVFEKLVGSGRRILNPLDSSINNARAMINSAHKRMVLDAVLRLANIPGMGHIITEIPREQVPVKNANLADLLTQMESKLKGMGFADARVAAFDAADEEIPRDQLADEFMTIFSPAVKAPKGEVAHLTTMVDGKPKFFEIDSRLLEALGGMDPYHMQKAFGALQPFAEIEHKLGTTFRMGATVFSPGFSFWSNPLRDFPNYLSQTRQKGGPAQLFSMYGKMLLAATTDNFIHNAEDRNAVVDLAKRLGLEGTTFLGQDIRSVERTRANMFGERRVRDMPLNMIGAIGEMLSTAERAPRLAEIAGLMKEQGIDPTKPLTLQQATDLMIAFKEVTTDFTKAGRLVRNINYVLPLFSAGVAGPRAFIEAAQRNPKQVGAVMSVMAAYALRNWIANKDEKWWQEIPAQQRYLYTHVGWENPITGTKEIGKFPRSYEGPGMIMSFTEAMLDSWYHQDPQYLSEWAQAFAKTTSPISFDPANPLSPELALNLPVGTRTLVQEWMNKDIFWNRDIVPQEMKESTPPAMQFNEYSSSAAKFIGKEFGISPMKIDFAIRSMGGGAPSEMQRWGEALTEGREKNPTLYRPFTGSDLVDALFSPVINRALAREGQDPTGGKSVDEFYNKTLKESTYARKETDDYKTKQLHSMVVNAQKTLAALRDQKRNATDLATRTEINNRIVDIARDINQRWQDKNFSGVYNYERRREEAKSKPIRQTKKEAIRKELSGQ